MLGEVAWSAVSVPVQSICVQEGLRDRALFRTDAKT